MALGKAKAKATENVGNAVSLVTAPQIARIRGAKAKAQSMNCRTLFTASSPQQALQTQSQSHRMENLIAGNARKASSTPTANGTIGKKKSMLREATLLPSLKALEL